MLKLPLNEVILFSIEFVYDCNIVIITKYNLMKIIKIIKLKIKNKMNYNQN